MTNAYSTYRNTICKGEGERLPESAFPPTNPKQPEREFKKTNGMAGWRVLKCANE